jgi:crotonobetainyl-CoA:carnitine CoA-transferase CaiB-like acyl-CoA transferase
VAGLLKGVRVLESAQLIITPVASQLLADEGADVIKVESPFRGDYLRDFLGQVKPHKRGHSPGFLAVNRNKKSIAVDLRKPEGKAIFERLLQESDVFFDGNAPGAVEKLGLSYEEVKKMKPDIVYARLSGFGADGPYAPVPTHGVSMSAVAGNRYAEKDERGYVNLTTARPA